MTESRAHFPSCQPTATAAAAAGAAGCPAAPRVLKKVKGKQPGLPVGRSSRD